MSTTGTWSLICGSRELCRRLVKTHPDKRQSKTLTENVHPKPRERRNVFLSELVGKRSVLSLSFRIRETSRLFPAFQPVSRSSCIGNLSGSLSTKDKAGRADPATNVWQ